MKQLALGLAQYVQDNDEYMPYSSRGSYVSGTLRSWIRVIHPYTKNYQIARCPSQKNDPYNIWSSGNSGDIYSQQQWPSYGFNYFYLNPNGGCENLDALGSAAFKPINIARIQQTSATVAFTEVKIIGSDADGYYSSYESEAPGTLGAGEPDECNYSDGGWGIGWYQDDPAYGGTTYTANIDARHLEGANVAFADGHVKWMTPGRLAQGTDWAVGKANTDVDIIDINQYIWDYR